MKFALIAIVICSASFNTFAKANFVLFKSHLDQANASQQKLKDAYETLGLTVEFQNYPFARGIQNAQAGYIDGMLATYTNENSLDSNLIRIDIDLGSIANVLVINRDMCQGCSVVDIKTVGLMSGNANSTSIELNNTVKVIKFTQFTSLLDFYERGRADAMLISAVSLPQAYLDNPKFKVITLHERKLYHYLHKKHQLIAVQIQSALSETTKTAVISDNSDAKSAEYTHKSSVNVSQNAAMPITADGTNLN